MPDRTELPPPAPLPVDDAPVRQHGPRCFGCGPDNPSSLGVHVVRDGDVVRATVTLTPQYEGSPGLAHGGIVATILDDVCGTVPIEMRQWAVTAKLDVDYLAPVVIGHRLAAEAWLASFEGRKISIVSRLLDGDTVLAIGRALFVVVPPEHFAKGGRDGAAWTTVGP